MIILYNMARNTIKGMPKKRHFRYFVEIDIILRDCLGDGGRLG
jgi:hypothetical protein